MGITQIPHHWGILLIIVIWEHLILHLTRLCGYFCLDLVPREREYRWQRTRELQEEWNGGAHGTKVKGFVPIFATFQTLASIQM